MNTKSETQTIKRDVFSFSYPSRFLTLFYLMFMCSLSSILAFCSFKFRVIAQKIESFTLEKMHIVIGGTDYF
jgi:hypothetical protein